MNREPVEPPPRVWRGATAHVAPQNAVSARAAAEPVSVALAAAKSAVAAAAAGRRGLGCLRCGPMAWVAETAAGRDGRRCGESCRGPREGSFLPARRLPGTSGLVGTVCWRVKARPSSTWLAEGPERPTVRVPRTRCEYGPPMAECWAETGVGGLGMRDAGATGVQLLEASRCRGHRVSAG